MRLEHAAACVAAFVFRALPLSASVGLGRMIGRAFYQLDHRHRKRVRDQITQAFGEEYTDKQALHLTRKMYRHFGTMLAEFVRLPTVTKDTLDTVVDWEENAEKLQAIVKEHGGVIFATGHLGNWEMGGYAFHLKGLTAGAIARPLDNPLLDAYVKSIRQYAGQEIWDKMGALRHVVRALRNGKSFGILVDQDAGKRGLFVPFFGRTASTIPTPADLALRTGAPIVVAAMHRADRPMRFRFRMCDPIYCDTSDKSPDERIRLLEDINAGVETLIRAEPAQWLWLHRRWKTRPKNEA